MTTGYITASLDTTRRKFPGSECVVTFTVRNGAGTAVDPAQVTFNWRYQNHNFAEKSLTPVNTDTGTYTATFTPERPGVISYRIDTTTPTAAYEGAIAIADSRFSLNA